MPWWALPAKLVLRDGNDRPGCRREILAFLGPAPRNPTASGRHYWVMTVRGLVVRDDSDARLVGSARAGDKDAFAALVDRHRGLLVALCRRVLGDPVLAEDAAQEAVLQALLALDRLRRPERFGPWLAGIGPNVCRGWLRDPARADWSWESLHGGRVVPEPVDRGSTPEEAAAALDLAARVRGAVDDLPRGQRAAGCSSTSPASAKPRRRICSGSRSGRSRRGCTTRASACAGACGRSGRRTR